MDIKRAKQEIKDSIEAYLAKDEFGEYLIPAIRQRPILLMGAPGIGKTQIMEQIARECKVGLVSYTITHHTRQSAVGLPFIKEKTFGQETFSVTEYTMSEIIASVYEKMEKTGLREGILFIDEINCVSETLAPMMLQFLQGKTFGNQKVPEGWVIVTAGNPPEYNRSVRDFDVVTLDRVKYIEVTPDYDIWKNYARKKGIHAAVLSYLDARQENFYKIETTVEGKRFVTARGWEDLSDIIKAYEKLGISVDEQVISQYLQDEDTAMDFANYLALYYKYEKSYNVKDILLANTAQSVYTRLAKAPFDERISVVSLVLGALNAEFKKYYRMTMTAQKLFDELKFFQKNEALVFSDVVKDMRNTYLRDKEKGLWDEDAQAVNAAVIREIGDYELAVKNAGVSEHTDVFTIISSEFMKLSDKREALSQQIMLELNNAFDFAEKAFGHGPEMVLFVTELAAGFYSISFIQENGCDKFYYYNKNMLRDNARQQLLDEI